MTDHTCTEKIGGDSIIFMVIQVQRKIVMTTLVTLLGTYRVRPIFSHILSSIVICMLNLSTMVICVIIMHIFCDLIMASLYYVLIIVVSFMVQIMNGVDKGLFIPSYTLTCICMTSKLYTRVSSL